jgi:hypothetical protein
LHQQGQMVDNNFQWWWDDRCIQRDPFSLIQDNICSYSIVDLFIVMMMFYFQYYTYSVTSEVGRQENTSGAIVIRIYQET